MNVYEYYGLDWLAMGLTLFAVYQLGEKKKFGFINFIISNLIWIYLALWMMDSYGMAIGNAIFVVINARGYINWKKDSATS